MFWESWSNCADVALMLVCLVTLAWLPTARDWERSLDALLLLLRNGLQALRIYVAVRHTRARRPSQDIFIDLEANSLK